LTTPKKSFASVANRPNNSNDVETGILNLVKTINIAGAMLCIYVNDIGS
jgi:hypothetical protein